MCNAKSQLASIRVEDNVIIVLKLIHNILPEEKELVNIKQALSEGMMEAEMFYCYMCGHKALHVQEEEGGPLGWCGRVSVLWRQIGARITLK